MQDGSTAFLVASATGRLDMIEQLLALRNAEGTGRLVNVQAVTTVHTLMSSMSERGESLLLFPQFTITNMYCECRYS